MTLSLIKLGIAALIPVIVTILFYHIENKERFCKLPYISQQVIIGIVFGCISILGTEWAIPIHGVLINCRDAAPLIAGLSFGAPAGIIAGIMGGVERWLAVYWGAGTFTREACSISTILAGFIAGFIKKEFLENKKPTVLMGVAIGCVMEVFHLTMVLITNVSEPLKAVWVIDTCLFPMAIANALSVGLASLCMMILSGDIKKLKYSFKSGEKTPIFDTIQRRLFILIFLSFILTRFFDDQLQNNVINEETENLIASTIEEARADISQASDEHMLSLTRVIAKEINGGDYDLAELAEWYGFKDLSIINKEGILIESNKPEYLGFTISSGEQSAEFMILNKGASEYVQPYRQITMSSNVYRKFCAVALNNGGFVQAGYDAKQFQKELEIQIKGIATNRKVGNYGGMIILDHTGKPVSITTNLDYNKLFGGRYDLSAIEIDSEPVLYELNDGNIYYIATAEIEGYRILILRSKLDADVSKRVLVYANVFNMIFIFAILYVAIYMLIRHVVVRQIKKMAGSLSNISQGNLDEIVDVRSSKEFASLSDDMNYTVSVLKRYIAEAAARIDAELEFAKNIQNSALPNVFPERDDFSIYCYMKTAKEVGGDFYDFYLTSYHTVHFLIADVSGKGIPAAMFMMRAKSVLKSFIERGLSLSEAFTQGNDSLCSGNDAGMFVTAWQAKIKTRTGKLEFVNAGHNLPVLKKKGGKFQYIKQNTNLVLGVMDGMNYKTNELQMEPGDTIFLYTDGVTEATNAEDELFGEQRLLDVLNAREYSSDKEVCDAVMAGVDDFVKEADQFDDITMVCFTYKNKAE